MTRDFYEILSVKKTATAQEIKASFRNLALRWHPDRNLQNKGEAEEHFKAIAEAYAILSDPDKRAKYDKSGREGLISEDFVITTADVITAFFRDTEVERYKDFIEGLTLIVQENGIGFSAKNKMVVADSNGKSKELPPVTGAELIQGQIVCLQALTNEIIGLGALIEQLRITIEGDRKYEGLMDVLRENTKIGERALKKL